MQTTESEMDQLYAADNSIRNQIAEQFTPESWITMDRLSSWWFNLDKLGGEGLQNVLFDEKHHRKDYLGKAVACVFLSAIANVDDYFDTHKPEFKNLSTDQLRDKMLNHVISDIDDSPITVADVMKVVQEYSDRLEDSPRRQLINSQLKDFNTKTFASLAWEVSDENTGYDHHQAWIHKQRTLIPYIKLGYLLGNEGPVSTKHADFITNMMLAMQIADDNKDFREDLPDTVNVRIGFYHEALAAGKTETDAIVDSEKKTAMFEFTKKVESGYYLLAARLVLSQILKT